MVLRPSPSRWPAGPRAHAQAADPNSAPNTYRAGENWAKLPAGRKMGSPIGVEIDRDGKSLWVFDRCGANDCAGSNVAPIMKFDPSGKLVTSFGAGMFAFPHGLAVDREGNVWVDRRQERHIVVKFAPDGKVLMTLGHQDVPGNGNDSFNQPSDVGGRRQRRYLCCRRTWRQVQRSHRQAFEGRQSSSRPGASTARRRASSIRRTASRSIRPGACSSPTGSTAAFRCSIRMAISSPSGSNSAGRAASSSTRTTCHTSPTISRDEKRNPGFKQGIRIGSVKDGKVTAMIPPDATLGAPEMVTADDQGAIYGGFTGNKLAVREIREAIRLARHFPEAMTTRRMRAMLVTEGFASRLRLHCSWRRSWAAAVIRASACRLLRRQAGQDDHRARHRRRL